MEYQIGDFSQISRLSIKTLRYYHECGLLAPSRIDEVTGYRFYDEACLERARTIAELKTLDFTLNEIKTVLDFCGEDADLIGQLTAKHREISSKIDDYRETRRKLETFIKLTKTMEANNMLNANREIIIKDIPDILAVSIRFKGKYKDVGEAFGKLFRHYGRYCSGSPFSLYYDADYKEEDADIEACVPVRSAVSAEGITCRTLKGGKALTILHHGPYETIGESYKVLIDHIKTHNLKTTAPSREVYLKGPGLIFPRSPKRYITELQMFIA